MRPDRFDDLVVRERGELAGVSAGHEQPDPAPDQVLQVSLEAGVVDVAKRVTRERGHGHDGDVGEDPGPRRPVGGEPR